MTKTRLKVALVLAVALTAPATAWAVGETAGRIGGVVTEAQTGAPVPGATVTANSKELIGGPRSVTTGDDGRYELVELPPGRYDVDVSYSGVKPIKRRVIVRQGEMLPLDIAWSAELAEAETTIVVEERHITRPDTTQSGTVVTADTSAKVATGRSYQDIAQQIAGVADVNGGGNPQVKGSNALSNKWLVDGLDISDAVLSTFSANINFDSISSVDVITGGMEAQYNSMGGVINLITQGGSDEWHVDSSIYINNAKFSALGQYGSQGYLYETPFSRVVPAPTQSYQANINVGGPILKHRLWFNISLQYSFTESASPAGPPLNVQAPVRRFNGVLARVKLTWAPNDKHRVTLSVSTDPAFISNSSTASANRRLPIAQTYQKQGGVFGILQWDYFINQNINTQVQAGFQWNNIDAGPMGAFPGSPGQDISFSGAEAMYSDKNRNYNFNEPQHVNQVDNTIWYQGRTTKALDNRYTFQLDPSISLRGKLAGSHDAKIGIQSRYVASTYDISYAGRGVSYVDNGGGPLESGLCDEATGTGGCFLKTVDQDYSQKYEGYSIGAYIQDRWKPWRRLTILPGIRFDYGFTKNTLGQMASNVFGVGPRLGFVLDLTGDQKTILSAYYGRSNDVSNLLPAAYGSPAGQSRTFLWNDATMAFDQQISGSGGSRGYVLDPNGPAPHTDQVAVSLRREIFANSVAGVEYTYKKIANMWDWREINQIWDPTGYRLVGFVDNSNPQQVQLITTRHNLTREYQGLDFWAESRPSPNWDIYVAYTLSWLYGSHADQFASQVHDTPGVLYNPRQLPFYQGFLPEDVRHQLKLRVSYNYKGFNVGGFFQYVAGNPLSKKFFQYSPNGDYINLRSPFGTDPGATPNNPRNFSEFRTPDLISFDLRVSYDFHALIKQHLVLIADLFNVFNLRTPTGFNEADIAATYGTVTTRQGPFRFQLGLRYMY
jgi:hypothetical protein